MSMRQTPNNTVYFATVVLSASSISAVSGILGVARAFACTAHERKERLL
jgi:hypothetical protein